MSARLLNFGRGEEDGLFEEAAEFLFADVVVEALAGGEVFERLVFHLQTLEVNDLKVKFAFIPNLALQQFHRGQDVLMEFASAGHPLPQVGEKGEGSAFFLGGLFGGDFLFSLLVGAVGHGLFLGRFFLVRFWGFITHDFIAFDFELTGRRHESFSTGDGMVPAGSGIVNDATAPLGARRRAGTLRRGQIMVRDGLWRVLSLAKEGFEGGIVPAGKVLGYSRLGRLLQNNCEKALLFRGNGAWWRGLLDSLSLSRHGKSSGELSSVMILNPKFGNSLVKETVSLGQLSIT